MLLTSSLPRNFHVRGTYHVANNDNYFVKKICEGEKCVGENNKTWHASERKIKRSERCAAMQVAHTHT